MLIVTLLEVSEKEEGVVDLYLQNPATEEVYVRVGGGEVVGESVGGGGGPYGRLWEPKGRQLEKKLSEPLVYR